jgi:hypothetical protein
VWGAVNGDLNAFTNRAEPGVWLQMGAFFAIMYSIGYRFAGAYVRDKAAEEAEAGASARDTDVARSKEAADA